MKKNPTPSTRPVSSRSHSSQRHTDLLLDTIAHLSTSDCRVVKKIIQDFPELNFRVGRKFSFKPPHTVILATRAPHYPLLLCHEIGHFLTQEFHFQTDLERLKIERHAWEQAQKLCQKYDIAYDENFIEDQLDSYRDWLHAKSLCKKCGLTCYQTDDGEYHCPHCDFQT